MKKYTQAEVEYILMLFKNEGYILPNSLDISCSSCPLGIMTNPFGCYPYKRYLKAQALLRYLPQEIIFEAML